MVYYYEILRTNISLKKIEKAYQNISQIVLQ